MTTRAAGPVRRADQDQLGRRPGLAPGPDDGGPAVEVERHGPAVPIAAGQAAQGVGEGPGVGRMEPQPRRGGPDGRHRAVDVGEADARAGRQPDRPRPGAEGDLVAREADVEAVVAGQLGAGEERAGRDEQVAGPGEREPAQHEELAAVGGGDLAPAAAELDAVQRVPRARLAGRGRCLGQGVEHPGRRLVPVDGRGGELGERRHAGDVVLARGGDAAVGPAGAGRARAGGLDRDGRLVAALEVGEGLERQGDGAGVGAGAGRDVLDGDAAVPISGA